jgi:hypothetical protein
LGTIARLSPPDNATYRTLQAFVLISSKRQRKKYGHLPAKEAEADPWTQVHVDMMGPLTVRDSTGKSKPFLVFTAIDPATGWFECVPVLSKDSHTVLNAFNNK